MVKNLLANAVGEDPLEQEMATHYSILGWEIPWTEEPTGLQFMGSQRVRRDLVAFVKCCLQGLRYNTGVVVDRIMAPK